MKIGMWGFYHYDPQVGPFDVADFLQDNIDGFYKLLNQNKEPTFIVDEFSDEPFDMVEYIKGPFEMKSGENDLFEAQDFFIFYERVIHEYSVCLGNAEHPDSLIEHLWVRLFHHLRHSVTYQWDHQKNDDLLPIGMINRISEYAHFYSLQPPKDEGDEEEEESTYPIYACAVEAPYEKQFEFDAICCGFFAYAVFTDRFFAGNGEVDAEDIVRILTLTNASCLENPFLVDSELSHLCPRESLCQ